MPMTNHYVRNRVQQRRQIAVFALFVVWFFALIVIDLGTDTPFLYTTIGWFGFIMINLVMLNDRIHK